METLLRDGEIRAARPPVAGMGHLTRINGTPDYKLCPWSTKGGSWAVPGTAVNAGTDPDRDDGGEPGSDADAGKQANRYFAMSSAVPFVLPLPARDQFGGRSPARVTTKSHAIALSPAELTHRAASVSSRRATVRTPNVKSWSGFHGSHCHPPRTCLFASMPVSIARSPTTRAPTASPG